MQNRRWNDDSYDVGPRRSTRWITEWAKVVIILLLWQMGLDSLLKGTWKLIYSAMHGINDIQANDTSVPVCNDVWHYGKCESAAMSQLAGRNGCMDIMTK